MVRDGFSVGSRVCCNHPCWLFVNSESKGGLVGPREPEEKHVRQLWATLQGVPLGLLSYPKMSSTLSRARKEQKAGSSPNRAAALMLLCQEPRPLRRRPGPQKALHLGARCARTRTWATADLSGARQRLGVWSWKGDRFITENRIRSPRAGVPIDKGSLLSASLSS